jgi:hypothetical protein
VRPNFLVILEENFGQDLAALIFSPRDIFFYKKNEWVKEAARHK